jgi:nitrogen regulatory protein PII
MTPMTPITPITPTNPITQTHEKRTLLTIVTEAAVEESVLRDLHQLGVSGYTVTDARGRGSRGVRNASWQEAANIRIEVICNRMLAESVLRYLQTHYYENYAMVSFMQDVEVLRPEKF